MFLLKKIMLPKNQLLCTKNPKFLTSFWQCCYSSCFRLLVIDVETVCWNGMYYGLFKFIHPLPPKSRKLQRKVWLLNQWYLVIWTPEHKLIWLICRVKQVEKTNGFLYIKIILQNCGVSMSYLSVHLKLFTKCWIYLVYLALQVPCWVQR